MTSPDTNLFLYAFNSDCPEHPRAVEVMEDLAGSTEVVVCDLVLVELYLLLRNPAVVRRPLEPAPAASVCRAWRANPRWRVVESAPVMDQVWERAAGPGFARRRILDARLAFTLRHHGVTTLVTRNDRDFAGFGFDRVWNPFD